VHLSTAIQTFKGVRFFETRDSGQVVINIIYLIGDELRIQVLEPSRFGEELQGLIDHGFTTCIGSHSSSRPTHFLEGLRYRYSGAYFRASEIEDIASTEVLV
jgi:hypothetical protein